MSIDWKDVGVAVAKTAPMLGTLLGGPAGGAIGAMIASAVGTGSTPAEVQQALIVNPDAAVKLKEIESKRQVELQALVLQERQAEMAATTATSSDVNATMQAEAKAEHWPTYSWRPFIGFVFGLNLLVASAVTAAVYIVSMCGVKAASDALATLPQMIGALGAVNGAALPILGIASWFRGRMQADPAIPTVNKG